MGDTQALETRTVQQLGGYTTVVYKTALGEFWRMSTRDGPAIKGLSPHSEPWSVIITAEEARAAAAALIRIADDIDGAQIQASGTKLEFGRPKFKHPFISTTSAARGT